MMLPSELLTLIARRRFIAEVRTETAQQALGVVEALARGGLAVFEISSAIPGVEEILRHYAASTEIMVGAGDVLDARQALEVAKAGARFISSPIVLAELIPLCQEQRILPILGALTPTEIIAAQRAGAEVVKIYPVSAMGGSQYIRSLQRHFSHLSIMVSGGITLENLPEYLPFPLRAISFSSTLTPRVLVERGDWPSLAHIARRIIDYAHAWEIGGGRATPPIADSTHPLPLDTVMAPQAPALSPPSARSQPSAPSNVPPSTPAVSPSFKPWDSRPAGNGVGDDWIR